MVPEGTYRSRAGVGWTIGQSKKGHLELKVPFPIKFTEEKNGKKIEHVETLTLYTHFSNQKTDGLVKMTEISFESCRFMGWKGQDVRELASPKCGLDANEVMLVVVHELSTTGSLRATIKYVNSVNGPSRVKAVVPMSEDTLAAFATDLLEIAATVGPDGRKTDALTDAATALGNGAVSIGAPIGTGDDSDVPF